MLEFAKKYEDQLIQIYYDIVFDDNFKWGWLGPCKCFSEPKADTNECHNFVSTYNSKVIGEIGYSIDFSLRKVSGLYCCHFSKDNGFIFMKDLICCLKNIFEKFRFNKIVYQVAIGNPIEKKWDRLTDIFGGRIIGIRKEDVLLQDGILYDIKEYEILSKDYFKKKGVIN
jgi:hypothetical protein